MAIDDNTLYGLTGAQVKELPGKIEAVKGLPRELTADDYNWNATAHDATTEPFDSIAVWLLPPGDYKVSALPVAWTIGQQPQPAGGTGPLTTFTGSFVVTRGLSDTFKGILKYDGVIVLGGGYGGSYDSPRWYRINTNTGVPQNVQDSPASADPYLLRGVNIAHDLTTDSRRQDLVLGAEQGKVLKDMIDAIIVPTQTSDLINDGADGTSTYVETDELATVATSGSYNDLSNKPTVPVITMTTTDPGEGVALAANHFIAVYNAS